MDSLNSLIVVYSLCWFVFVLLFFPLEFLSGTGSRLATFLTKKVLKTLLRTANRKRPLTKTRSNLLFLWSAKNCLNVEYFIKLSKVEYLFQLFVAFPGLL